MTTPSFSLLVLQSRDIEAAKAFYDLLGVTFIEEQHGTGPRHYSANLNGIVFEIYPSGITSALRMGFHVDDLDRMIERLREHGAKIVQEAKDSPWGRRVVVEDPDGNRIELTACE